MGQEDATNRFDVVLAELAALRERVGVLENENRALRASAGSEGVTGPAGAGDEAAHGPARRVSRRTMIATAASAAAAGIAVVAAPTPAAAAGTPVVLDGPNSPTNTVYIDGSFAGPVIAVSNNGSGSAVYGSSVAEGAVVGTSYIGNGIEGTSAGGNGVLGQSGSSSGLNLLAGVVGDSGSGVGVSGSSTSSTGVLGVTGGRSGFTARAGVVGDGTTGYGVGGFSKSNAGVRAASTSSAGVNATSTTGVGIQTSGGRAAINLVPRSTSGRPTTGAHSRGDLVVDAAGTLYLCSASGTPGTWKRVTVTSA